MPSYDARRIDVPGGWIYFGGPLASPVLVSDPSQWARLPEHVAGQLDRVLASLSNLHMEFHRMSAEMDDLTAQVAASRTVIDSAVVLINGIAARIAAAGVDPAALSALTTDLKAETDNLSAAVQANTPPA